MKYNFDENLIKGRIAETLIEQLFTRMGYQVFRYGMENTIPGIIENMRTAEPIEVINEIRKMPDFIVKHPVSNSVYYIEVKFRADGNFSLKQIGENYPYKNTYFIVISKRHIKCLSYAELEEGQEITANSRNYLGSREDFITDKGIIIKFCKFAIKFFECV